MDIYVYIDETGDFDEGTRRSSVVAALTRYNDGQLKESLKNACKCFNNSHKTNFKFPDDMHCAPLIMGTNYSGKPIRRYKHIDADTRLKFSYTVLSTIAGIPDLQLTVSQSPSDRIDYDSQHNYVDNLFAVVYNILEKIAGGHYVETSNVGTVHFSIATRRGLGKHVENNEKKLRDYLARSCERLAIKKGNAHLRDLTSGAVFTHKVADKHAGLVVADFCAYFWRGSGNVKRSDLREKLKRKIWETGPDDPNRVELREGIDLLIKSELEMFSDFGALYAFALEFGDQKIRNYILSTLPQLKDFTSLAQQCGSLLNTANRLLKERLVHHHNLPEAQELYTTVGNITAKALDDDSPPPENARSFADIHLKSIDGLMRCANHRGDNSQQLALREEFQRKLERYTDLLGGYRQARILEWDLLNRFCNLYANEYRFEEMIDTAEPIYEKLTSDLPRGQTDELVGELAGTLGQAYAFMARKEPDWHEESEKRFKESIRHFPQNPRYRGMSANFLATLAWQHGNSEKATEYLALQPELEKVSRPDDLWNSVTPLADNTKNHFTLVNILRVLALEVWHGGMTISPTDMEKNRILHNVHEAIQPDELYQHPIHQLHKWLAMLQLAANFKKNAMLNTSAALDKAQKLDFTVHTIAVSVYPIRYRAAGDMAEIAQMIKQLGRLAEQVEPFARYIDRLGGIDDIARRAASQDDEEFWRAVTFLPFAYA